MKPTIAVDFDGVIHRYSEGWKDGSIYDIPVEDAGAALRSLSRDYRIIIHTTRKNIGNPKNPETGTVWDWLRKHNLDCYVDDITNTKPAEAKLFIDDRAIHFSDWDSTIKLIKPALKIFGKSLSFGKKFFIKSKKTDNSQYALFGTQLDLFNQPEGTVKQFGKDDTRKLQTTASGKKRWIDADKESGETPISDLPSGETVKSPSGEAGLVKQTQRPQAKESKEPYEMTASDYFRSIGFHKLEDGHLTLKQEGEFGKIHTKKLGRTRTKFWLRDQERNHQASVQQALSEGKTVPEEVLKDYPELQKKWSRKVEKKEVRSQKSEESNPLIPKGFILETSTQKFKFTGDVDSYGAHSFIELTPTGRNKVINKREAEVAFPKQQVEEYLAKKEKGKGKPSNKQSPQPEGKYGVSRKELLDLIEAKPPKGYRKEGRYFVPEEPSPSTRTPKDGVQPNQENLFQKAEEIKRDENFKKWFGDSKVVDENGEPLVVYHGTPYSFNNFDVTHKLGIHFGTAEQANERISRLSITPNATEFYRDQSNLLPTYIKIENPLSVGELAWEDRNGFLEELDDLGLLNDKFWDAHDKNITKDDTYKSIREGLKALGYDGIVYINQFEGEQPAESFIVFNPTQIKSIYNKGTFDADDKDITKSIKTIK